MEKEKTVKELHLERKKMWNASISNHAKFLNSKTQLFDNKYVEQRTCPICGSEKERHIFNKSGGQYKQCEVCSMVFLNPVIKDQYLEEYYNNNHMVQSEIVENDSEFYLALYTKGLECSSRFGSNNGKLLDIGCSSGIFLNLAKSNGFDTYGIELNKSEATVASKRGHKVFTNSIYDINLELQFDVITLWDVFEHIKDSPKFIAKIKSLLSPSGKLFLQIPSADSIAAKILQEKCNMFDGLEHVNLFTEKALKLLMGHSGFKIVSLTSVIPEIGVINNYLEYQNPYLGDTTNCDMLFKTISQQNVLELNLGYKYQVLCQLIK